MKIIRAATSEDMNEVYMMGYDVWGDDLPSEEYVTMCRESSKLKRKTGSITTTISIRWRR